MDTVLMISVIIAIVIYPQRNTFVDKFKFKLGFKGFEFEFSAKEKNDPPYESDRSHPKK